jgi:hypothetical protein
VALAAREGRSKLDFAPKSATSKEEQSNRNDAYIIGVFILIRVYGVFLIARGNALSRVFITRYESSR